MQASVDSPLRLRSLELEELGVGQPNLTKMAGCSSPVTVKDPGSLLRQLVRSPLGP